MTIESKTQVGDTRALSILAKTIYRELRGGGYETSEVVSIASELLGLVASEVRVRREGVGPHGVVETGGVSLPVTRTPAEG